MQLALLATFTLNVHNVGDSPAYGLSITDVLPNGETGGSCDVAPDQFTAQVFEADGVTAVSPVLVENSDFAATFNGEPDCTLIISMLTNTAAIGADLVLNGSDPFTIVGVAPEHYWGTVFGSKVDLWYPLAMRIRLLRTEAQRRSDPHVQRQARRFWLVGRLEPGVSLADSSQIRVTVTVHWQEGTRKRKVGLGMVRM